MPATQLGVPWADDMPSTSTQAGPLGVTSLGSSGLTHQRKRAPPHRQANTEWHSPSHPLSLGSRGLPAAQVISSWQDARMQFSRTVWELGSEGVRLWMVRGRSWGRTAGGLATITLGIEAVASPFFGSWRCPLTPPSRSHWVHSLALVSSRPPGLA